jgi:hypothetical protein
MKRVWKPLDVAPGYRLYQVLLDWGNHRQYRVVAAKSPSHAAQLLEEIYRGASKKPIITGYALNVLMPESWWMDGVPCGHSQAMDGKPKDPCAR